MTEILLTLIILAMLCYHVYFVREVNKKEHQYVQAILAKSLPELIEAQIDEQPKPVEVPKDKFVAMDTLTDDEFDTVLFDKK